MSKGEKPLNIKRFLIMLLAICLLCALCACSSAEPAPGTTAAPTAGQTADTDEEPAVDDNKTAYTVKVVDGEGNPMAGVAVQICKDSCMPGVTDAQGVAIFRVVEAEGYKVSFLTVPEGYTAEAEEFYFEAGVTEMTLTLTAA